MDIKDDDARAYLKIIDIEKKAETLVQAVSTSEFAAHVTTTTRLKKDPPERNYLLGILAIDDM